MLSLGQRRERAVLNYASVLGHLGRFEEARSLLRPTIPVALRVVGENHEYTLRLRLMYAGALFRDNSATLEDLREAVTTLEEIEPIGRRVLGGTHSLTSVIESELQIARAALCSPTAFRAALRARETAETPSGGNA